MPKELPANGKTAERVYITRNSERFMTWKNTKIKINDSRLETPHPNVPNFPKREHAVNEYHYIVCSPRGILSIDNQKLRPKNCVSLMSSAELEISIERIMLFDFLQP